MRTGIVIFLLVVLGLPSRSIAADVRRIDIADPSDMGSINCLPATPNDNQSDQISFQCALDSLNPPNQSNCKEAKPGVIHVPAGQFDLESQLTLRCGVQLVGNGFQSILYQMQGGDWTQSSLLYLESETIVRDLKLDQFQPDDKPEEYDFMVRCQGDDILIENVMLYKAYKGITVGGLGLGNGRVTLRNIRGQPLAVGIAIDNALDVIRVEDVHFWPFWSSNLPDDRAIVDFVRSQGVAIFTAKNDNPFFNNLFFYGYGVGIAFATSVWPDPAVSGSTKKAKISHLDCDFCRVGISLAATGAVENVVFGYSFLPLESAYALPLQVTGERNGISVSEANVDLLSTSAVEVLGKNNFVRVSQWYVRRWNVAGNNSSAFVDLGAGNRLWVKDSYGRWPNGGGTCLNALSCDFVLGQNF